jgi:alpha-tubulin suppressor-like RCC1 family protein
MRFNLLVAVSVLLLASVVQGSHFRGAFYSWRKSNPANSKEVEFTVTVAWRANVTSSGSYIFAANNDDIVLNYGDGSATSAGLTGTTLLDNFDITGEYIIVRQRVNHTFPSNGVYTSTWNSFIPATNYGARALFPNTQPIPVTAPYGAVAIVSTVVDLSSGYDSPIAQIPLVLQLPISRPGFFATYQLPVADPAGLGFVCTLATSIQSGIAFQANVSSGTIGVTPGCEIRWDTSGGHDGQAWAVQVTVSQSGTQTTIPLDFIVVLVNGTYTPVCIANTNSTQIVPAGQNFTFIFTGYTPNATYAFLRASQLTSQDGVFIPALPVNGSVIGANFTLSFVVAPKGTQTAELMTLEITDALGYQTYCSASFQGQATVLAPYCNTTATAPIVVSVGSTGSAVITGYTANPGITSLNITAVQTYSDITLSKTGTSSLPAPTTVTATPTAAGSETVIVQFKDADNLEEQCSVVFNYIDVPTCSFTASVTPSGGVYSAFVGSTISGTVTFGSPNTVTTTVSLSIPDLPAFGTDTINNAAGTATYSLTSPAATSVSDLDFVVTDSFGKSTTCTLVYQFNPIPTTPAPTTPAPTTPLATTPAATTPAATTPAATTPAATTPAATTPAATTQAPTTVTPTVTPTTPAPTTPSPTTRPPTTPGPTTPVPTTGPACPQGSFFDGSSCVLANLLTGFGEADYGAMGVGNVGTSGIVESPRLVPYIPNENVLKIQTGPRHSSIVTNTGNLYVAGLNENGQLGINTTVNHNLFVLVTYFVNISRTVLQAFPGGYHTLVLLDNSSVWGFGLNNNGQLGQGSAGLEQYELPVPIALPGLGTEVPLGVATGFQHSLVWTATRVYAFGSGEYDQVGSSSNVVTPTVVFNATAGDTVAQVTAGGYSSAIRTGSGKVYTFGRNLYGNLGLGSYTNTKTPTHVTFPAGVLIKSVSSAEKHSLFVTTDSPPVLYAVGDNSCGNLGTEDTTNHASPIVVEFFVELAATGEDIVGVGTGWSHSLVWTPLNLYTFGCDSAYNLGIPQSGASPNIVSTPTPNMFYNSTNVVIGADCKGHYSLVLSKLVVPA